MSTTHFSNGYLSYVRSFTDQRFSCASKWYMGHLFAVYVLLSQSMFLSITLYLHGEKQPKETASIDSITKTCSQNETLQ